MIKTQTQQGLIVAVMKHFGIPVSKSGLLRCPFHDDKNPSARISIKYGTHGTFRCFACGINLTPKQFFKKYLQEKHRYSEELIYREWKKFISRNPILNSSHNYYNLNPHNERSNDLSILEYIWKEIINNKEKIRYDDEVIKYLKKRKLPIRLLDEGVISILPKPEPTYFKDTIQFKDIEVFLKSIYENGYKIAIPHKKMVNNREEMVSIQFRNVDRNKSPKAMDLKYHRTGSFIYLPNKHNTPREKLIITEGSIDFLQAISITNFNYNIVGIHSTGGDLKAIREIIINNKVKKIILIPRNNESGIKLKYRILRQIFPLYGALNKTLEFKEIDIESYKGISELSKSEEKIIIIGIKSYKDLSELLEHNEYEKHKILEIVENA